MKSEVFLAEERDSSVIQVWCCCLSRPGCLVECVGTRASNPKSCKDLSGEVPKKPPPLLRKRSIASCVFGLTSSLKDLPSLSVTNAGQSEDEHDTSMNATLAIMRQESSRLDGTHRQGRAEASLACRSS